MRLATTPEELLWKNVLSGDHRSFSELFDRYWEPFFQYAYKILQNREDTEELVQEFFIHLWNKREELPELQSVPSYLFTALKNRLLNQLAKKKYRVASLDSVKENESHLSATENLEKKNTEKVIRSLAKLLPEKMQQAYMLHQFRGLSITEIALETGNSEQTIRNQINTAVKKLSVVYRDRMLSLLPLSLYFFHYFGF
ncbi:MAG TPA: sigma-70 family RNA polymerase sigma factor [Puia sp.]